MTHIARLKHALYLRIALLGYLLINAFLQYSVYSLQSESLIHTAKAHPSFQDVLLYHGYVVTLLMCPVLFILLASAFITRIGSRTFAVVLIAIEAALLLLIVLDNKIYMLIGLHLYDDFVFNSLLNPYIQEELELDAGTLLFLALFLIVVLLFQVGVWAACRRTLQWSHVRQRILLRIQLYLVVAVTAVSATTTITLAPQARFVGNYMIAALPLYDPLFEATGVQHRLQTHYPRTPAELPELRHRKDIVVVVIETLRSDVINKTLTPNIVAFADRHASIHAEYSFSGGYTTEHSVFSILYGLDAYHYSTLCQEQTPSYPLEVLRHNGYQLVGCVASKMQSWGYSKFMMDQFDVYRQFTDAEVYENDRQAVSWVGHLMKERDATRPLFLFVFLNSTHYKYHYPPEFATYTPASAPDNYRLLGSDTVRESREEIWNQYRNSVTYVDHVFGDLTAILEDHLRSGNTVLVMTGDHGEEFWEHGLFGHAAPRFINQRVRVPLLLCLPDVDYRTIRLASHSDIMPTIVDYAGAQPQVAANLYANGRSLVGPQADDRYVVVSSTGFPYGHRLLCLITTGEKLWLEQRGERIDNLAILQMTDLNDRPLDPQKDPAYVNRLMERFRRSMFDFFEIDTPSGKEGSPSEAKKASTSGS